MCSLRGFFFGGGKKFLIHFFDICAASCEVIDSNGINTMSWCRIRFYCVDVNNVPQKLVDRAGITVRDRHPSNLFYYDIHRVDSDIYFLNSDSSAFTFRLNVAMLLCHKIMNAEDSDTVVNEIMRHNTWWANQICFGMS